MAEAIVPHLLPQILDILRRESSKASEYEDEFEKLKVLIEFIEQLLTKANSMEAINVEHKSSMKQARKFLYDAKDAIDDLLHESNRPLEGLLSNSYVLFNRGKFVSRAKDIRDKVNAYETTRKTIAALDSSGQLSADHPTSSSARHLLSSIAFTKENDSQLVGIDDARKQLVQWLTDDSMSKVIFVHGVQGVGKTSMVGTVLRHKRVKAHFRYYVWIKDLRSYELDKANEDVLMEMDVEMWDLNNKSNRPKQVKLKQAFEHMGKDNDLSNNNYRWALVLDDVGQEHVIESLQSHLDPTCPSVLITTCNSSLESCARRLASVSVTSADTPGLQCGRALPKNNRDCYISRRPVLKPGAFANSQPTQFSSKAPKRLYGFHNFKHVSLSKDHSLELFRQVMFNGGSCPTHLKIVSQSILDKCEGLPLAILATCHLLSYNQRCANGKPPIVEWQNCNGRLGEELLSKGKISGLIKRMITLRRDQLHDVQDCLFYLSMFPLNYHIRCSTLMRLWMAERFATQKGSRTAQAIADENLEKLLHHNLIQEAEKTSNGRVRTCRVHKLQHQIIMNMSKDNEFAMIVADQKIKWPENLWRLSFHSSSHRSASADEYQMDSIKDDTRVKRLRSLLVFKEVYPKSIEVLLGQVVRLNVLHLEASLNSFPKGIPSLKYLRYLKLRGTGIKNIPKGIRYPAYLETLDLKETCVSDLHDGISELKALRHLLVYRSDRNPDAKTIPKHGVKVPSNLGVLKSLQKLCMIKLDQVKQNPLSKIVHGKRCEHPFFAELRQLENLQRLGISELRTEHMGPLCSSIEKLQQLEALQLIAASGEMLNLPNMDESKAPRSLQRVHLTGRLGTLPNWIVSCDSLTKLVLKERQLNGDLLQHLKELPSLKHLELEQVFDASEITFEAEKFKQLCFLGLDRFDKLASLRFEEGALPTLEKLSLARCQLLTGVPRDITCLKELKWLELYDMPNQFMTAVKKNEKVHKHMKVVRKHWNNGMVVEVIPPPADRPRSPLAARPCMK